MASPPRPTGAYEGWPGLKVIHHGFDAVVDRGGRHAHRGQDRVAQPVAAEQDDRHQDPAEDFLEPDAPATTLVALFAPRHLRRCGRDGGGLQRTLVKLSRHALTNGTFGTVRTPPP